MLINGVESWLKSLSCQVKSTLKNLMQQCRIDIENGMTIEDWTLKVIHGYNPSPYRALGFVPKS